jgi:hypothetical protein
MARKRRATRKLNTAVAELPFHKRSAALSARASPVFRVNILTLWPLLLMIAANLGGGAMLWRKSILAWIVILAVAILCRLFLPRNHGLTLYLKGSTHYLGLNIVISWVLITVPLILILAFIIQHSRT